MSVVAGRYLVVVAGLLMASMLLTLPHTSIAQLGPMDLAYGLCIGLGLFLVMLGMFWEGLPDKNNNPHAGPTLLGTIGAGALVAVHDGGIARLLVVGLLATAIAIPAVVARLRTSSKA